MDQFSAPINSESILATKNPNRDFGLLKVRSLKVKSAQTPLVIGKNQQFTSFDKMSHEEIIKIINNNDIQRKKDLSKWFFSKNGMYSRAVRYLSDIYKFDFILYPNIDLDNELPESEQKTILKKFNAVLEHFDNSSI